MSEDDVTGVNEYAPDPFVVYYRLDDEEVHVGVNFGDLSYKYRGGTWNPDSLSYVGGFYDKEDTFSDRIIVYSETCKELDVEIEYQKAAGYEDIEGVFQSSDFGSAYTPGSFYEFKMPEACGARAEREFRLKLNSDKYDKGSEPIKPGLVVVTFYVPCDPDPDSGGG